MDSWEALKAAPLRQSGPITAAFVATGTRDFRAAAALISSLDYGRNTSPGDTLCVLREGRGTCSTKHALLCRLAREQGLDIALFLGIYEMNEANTPGVGNVLTAHGLTSLPEAHCFLGSGPKRIDVTRQTENRSKEAIVPLYEEKIDPDQIGDYKAILHRRYLSEWLERKPANVGYTLEHLWRIRERCIAALQQP